MTSFLKYDEGVLMPEIAQPRLGNCPYKQERALSYIALAAVIAGKGLDPILGCYSLAKIEAAYTIRRVINNSYSYWQDVQTII